MSPQRLGRGGTPRSGLQEIPVATRQESGVLFFPSRRGLTLRVSRECNPEIPVGPVVEHWVLDTSVEIQIIIMTINITATAECLWGAMLPPMRTTELPRPTVLVGLRWRWLSRFSVRKQRASGKLGWWFTQRLVPYFLVVQPWAGSFTSLACFPRDNILRDNHI